MYMCIHIYIYIYNEYMELAKKTSALGEAQMLSFFEQRVWCFEICPAVKLRPAEYANIF